MTVRTLQPGSFLVEDAIDTLIGHLRDNLNTALDMVYGDYAVLEGANNPNLTHVAPDRYYISEMIQPVLCPAIFILAAGTRFDNDEAQLHVKSNHDLLLAVLVEDVETQRLTTLTMRYVRALFKTLHPVGDVDLSVSTPGRPDGSSAMQFVATSINYSPIFRKADGSNRFRKDATLRLNVLHHERF